MKTVQEKQLELMNESLKYFVIVNNTNKKQLKLYN